MDTTEFTALVDHTLLKAEATAEQVRRLCEEAMEYHTHSVCVNGLWVATVHGMLGDSGVATCAVVGFPLGAGVPAAKAREAELAVEDGASEIDMVMSIGQAIEGDWDAVGRDIAAVRQACGPDALLKVILETAVIGHDRIPRACRVAVANGADYVKTSTGFHPSGGASVEAVRLMRETVGPGTGVKASGGIRDLATVEAMVEAGADRLGLSGTAAIVAEIERGGQPEAGR